MNIKNLRLARGFLACLFLCLPLGSFASTASEKASLQAAMQRHIDSALVDGRYLHLDTDTGEVRALRPLAAHPIILRMGEYFVLCADFRAEDGREVNVDFFLARKGRSYVVFDEQVENRALVKRLMKSGKASRLK